MNISPVIFHQFTCNDFTHINLFVYLYLFTCILEYYISNGKIIILIIINNKKESHFYLWKYIKLILWLN